MSNNSSDDDDDMDDDNEGTIADLQKRLKESEQKLKETTVKLKEKNDRYNDLFKQYSVVLEAAKTYKKERGEAKMAIAESVLGINPVNKKDNTEAAPYKGKDMPVVSRVSVIDEK